MLNNRLEASSQTPPLKGPFWLPRTLLTGHNMKGPGLLRTPFDQRFPKFLYARDLRLDKPISGGAGIAEIPIARLRGFAFEALRRLIDCALEREVDFLLLEGCICDTACGPDTPAALAKELARLYAAGSVCCVVRERPEQWMAGFPPGVHWLNDMEEIAHVIEGGGDIALSLPLIFAGTDPKPLQACLPDDEGVGGAWLITMNENSSEKEFIACDALRRVSRSLDAADLECAESPPWEKMKEELRVWAEGRPVLVRLKLTGVEGELFPPGFEGLVKKLNEAEREKENFVIIDSLQEIFSPELYNLENWESDLKKFPAGRCFEADFFQEISSFKAQIDPRLTLCDIFKERCGRVLPAEAAAMLEALTEADIGSLLRGSYAVARNGLFGYRKWPCPGRSNETL